MIPPRLVHPAIHDPVLGSPVNIEACPPWDRPAARMSRTTSTLSCGCLVDAQDVVQQKAQRSLTDLVLGVVRVAQASPSGQSSTRVEAMVCTLYLVPDLGLGLAFPTGPRGRGEGIQECRNRCAIWNHPSTRTASVPCPWPIPICTDLAQPHDTLRARHA